MDKRMDGMDIKYNVQEPLLEARRQSNCQTSSELGTQNTRFEGEMLERGSPLNVLVDGCSYMLRRKPEMESWRHLKRLVKEVHPIEGLVFIPIALLELVLVGKIGTVAGSIYKALVELDGGAIRRIILAVCMLYACNISVICFKEWISGTLSVKWRHRLVKRLHTLYMQSQAFAQLPVDLDNPDQRLTIESNTACNILSVIIKNIAASPLKVLFYGYIATRYIGVLGVGTVILFFFMSVALQKVAALPYSRDVMRLEKFEGDFRSKHMRLKTLRRDIATQGSIDAEGQALETSLQRVVDMQAKVVQTRTFLLATTKSTDYLGSVLNYVLIAVAVLTGSSIQQHSGGQIAEFVSNASFFTLTFVNSFTEIIDMAQEVSQLIALTSRIFSLVEVVDSNAASSVKPASPDRFCEHRTDRELGPTSLAPILMPPMTFEFDSLGMTMEVSMAKIDGSILEDVLEVFPSAPRNQPLICILTLQAYKTQGALDDLSAMDVSLERYLAWEKAIREVIGPKYWCDSVDPKTGKALREKDGSSWSEVVAFHSLLGYPIEDDGGICPLIFHPEYGTSTYPVSFFTSATVDHAIHAMHHIGGKMGERPTLLLQSVDIHCPDSSQPALIQGLFLHLHLGQHVLISGPNGSGKSTLLRALCCQDSSSRGRIEWNLSTNHPLPIMHSTQTPILAPGKHLWEQVVYPLHERCSDSVIIDALVEAGLHELVQHPGALETCEDWSTRLSYGQQQRLALARVFLYKPFVVLMDEATSGMSEEDASHLIRRIQSMHNWRISCITVAQDTQTMRRLHTMHLKLNDCRSSMADPNRRWNLSRIHHASP